MISAPTLAEVGARHGIDAPPLDPAAAASAWGFGERRWLRNLVAEEAVAVWRLWLAESNGLAAEASAAFEAWASGQRRPCV